MKLSERPNHPIPETHARRAQENHVPDPETGCWNTTYAVNKGTGYSTITWQVDGRAISTTCHRASWSFTNGKIPDGMVVDHICHNRRCVNPDHLRLLTLMQNNIRRNNSGAHDFSLDTCQWGHPLSMMKMQEGGKNAGRWRRCSACMKEINDSKTQIIQALRSLEITYGLGDWHEKKSYAGHRRERQARVDAVFAGQARTDSEI